MDVSRDIVVLKELVKRRFYFCAAGGPSIVL